MSDYDDGWNEGFEFGRAKLQAVVDAAKAVVESEKDARRQQVTHWQNPTIDILEQAIKEVE